MCSDVRDLHNAGVTFHVFKMSEHSGEHVDVCWCADELYCILVG